MMPARQENCIFLNVGLVELISKESISQSTGTETEKIMSQDAVTKALALMASVGFEQSWINVAASRTSGVTYTNTTERPVMVSIIETGNGVRTLKVDDLLVAYSAGADSDSTMQAIVPAGSTYLYTGQIHAWMELR